MCGIAGKLAFDRAAVARELLARMADIIVSTAQSLKARSPLLDHLLVEFTGSMPPDLKLRGHRTKYILKKAMAAILLEEVLRRPKMGFGVPVAEWFRGELRHMAHDILLGERAVHRGYFRPVALEKLLEDHRVRGVNGQYQPWNLLMLELWHAAFVDRPARAAAGDGLQS